MDFSIEHGRGAPWSGHGPRQPRSSGYAIAAEIPRESLA
jgi:hypothetical protein